MIIVVSGPGGVGKGTVVARLVERDPNLHLSRSATTRERRPGEPEDAYDFVDRATFEERIAAGGFLEWAEFLGNYYGTPVPDEHDDHDVLLEIDVQGAQQVAARFGVGEVVLVFIEPPSREELRARLVGRGDPPEAVERRLAKADEETEAARALGATFVVNDDLEATVAQLADLIDAARHP